MTNFKQKLFGFLSTDRWYDSMIFFLRLFAGIMMLTHGIAKINNYEMLYTTFPDPIGWGSKLSLISITLIETLGATCLIVGLFVRPAALVLAIGMVFATFMSSPDASIAQNELAFIYMGIFIALFIGGGAKYSLDSALFRIKPQEKRAE